MWIDQKCGLRLPSWLVVTVAAKSTSKSLKQSSTGLSSGIQTESVL
tara:strand:- start:425 stop:562 length:138 start_codon:yes stop_codon:yes gene_type:complete